MNSGTTYEANVTPRGDVGVIKHGLKIPADIHDYPEFVERMKESEREFVAEFS